MVISRQEVALITSYVLQLRLGKTWTKQPLNHSNSQHQGELHSSITCPAVQTTIFYVFFTPGPRLEERSVKSWGSKQRERDRRWKTWWPLSFLSRLMLRTSNHSPLIKARLTANLISAWERCFVTSEKIKNRILVVRTRCSQVWITFK